MSVTGLPEDGFGLGTFADGDRVFPALVRPDGGVVDIGHRWADLHAVLDAWDAALPVLRAAAATDESRRQVEDLRALPPLWRPNVIQSAANYRTHVIQMMTHSGLDRHDDETEEQRVERATAWVDRRVSHGKPFLFAGLASAMCGADDDVEMPAVGRDHDWELELTVVIGRPGRHVPPERALELVAGYTIANDMGTLDLARRDDAGPFTVDLLTKNQPTFLPVGPYVVPKEFLPDPGDLRIKLSVNGETRQDESTKDMIFNVQTLVSFASSLVSLRPGDLLLTGSPAGNGGFWGRYLRAGDVIESEITGLGRQRNRCVPEKVGMS